MSVEQHGKSSSSGFSDDEKTINDNSKTPSIPDAIREEKQGDETGPSIAGLARQFKEQSVSCPQTPTMDYNPFLSSDIPALDPNSGDFSPVRWIQALLDANARDADRYPSRTLGVSHRNLSVHGFGSDVNYQADVLSVFSRCVDMARTLLGKRGRTVQILRGFDGLVKSSEMLLVLGRPGRYVLVYISPKY